MTLLGIVDYGWAHLVIKLMTDYFRILAGPSLSERTNSFCPQIPFSIKKQCVKNSNFQHHSFNIDGIEERGKDYESRDYGGHKTLGCGTVAFGGSHGYDHMGRKR
jgi:hypothetical protein